MLLRSGEDRANAIAYLQRACEGLDILPAAGGCGSRVHRIGGRRRLAFSLAAASRAFGVRFADAAFYAASRFVFFCASDIRYSKGERIWMAF